MPRLLLAHLSLAEAAAEAVATLQPVAREAQAVAAPEGRAKHLVQTLRRTREAEAEEPEAQTVA